MVRGICTDAKVNVSIEVAHNDWYKRKIIAKAEPHANNANNEYDLEEMCKFE